MAARPPRRSSWQSNAGTGSSRPPRSWRSCWQGYAEIGPFKDVCREHEIAETLYYSWRDKLLEGGRLSLTGKDERAGEKEMKKKIRELERSLTARPMSWRSREALRMS